MTGNSVLRTHGGDQFQNLRQWIRANVKNRIWISVNDSDTNNCFTFDPQLGTSRIADCENDVASFVCAKSTDLNEVNYSDLVDEFKEQIAEYTARSNSAPKVATKEEKNSAKTKTIKIEL